jgi:threonine synthase
MQNLSTRGNCSPKLFSETLLEGLAADGGLFLPETYPQVTVQELARWRKLSYPRLAWEVIRKFATDIPPDNLWTLVERTYTSHIFGSLEITPLKTLEENLHLLGLSYGPTLAFKDIAMQLLGNLFEYVLGRNANQLNILGATSGDTGSAAEYAMRGKKGIRVFMLSPHGRMSPFQRAQMYSLSDQNIFNIAIEGSFDDCQKIVKAVSNDAEFKARHSIGTVNSINWARLLAQVVYYFKGYFAVTRSHEEKVSFAVPSGNFGNICAGHIARCMGLPIDQLILATNENNVLDEFFSTGIYSPRKTEDTYVTSSPSMDISQASNFERFVFDLVGREPSIIRSLWSKIESGGLFDLSQTPYFHNISKYGFVSGKSTHADRLKTIRQVWESYRQEIDPHTADGLKVGLEYRKSGIPLICLETALPIKFEETLMEALRRRPTCPINFLGIEQLPQNFTILPADTNRVKVFMDKNASARTA